uniref:Uncharacterized protein n=1 Tax=Oryza brachyantha TaxID=4533 RepID=J3N608_ORYBR
MPCRNGSVDHANCQKHIKDYRMHNAMDLTGKHFHPVHQHWRSETTYHTIVGGVAATDNGVTKPPHHAMPIWRHDSVVLPHHQHWRGQKLKENFEEVQIIRTWFYENMEGGQMQWMEEYVKFCLNPICKLRGAEIPIS